MNLCNLIACAALALLTPGTIVGATITAAEYFIGVDPGQGEGTAIPISSPADELTLHVVVEPTLIEALGSGFHRIACRYRNDDDVWSIPYYRTFYKAPDPTPVEPEDPVTAIVAAEYFINEDPGQGEGTAISLTPGERLTLNVDVDPGLIAPLPDGFHRLGVRYQNNAEQWSISYYRSFLKRSGGVTPGDDLLLAHIEYQWWQDGEPVGDPIILSPDAPALRLNYRELASLAGLEDGEEYQIEFTPVDTAGQRGIPVGRSVQVNTSDSDGDGVPDLWETTHGFDPSDPSDMDRGMDFDGEGLDNKDEFLSKTNPRISDSDGDGLNDRAEIDLAGFGFDPNIPNPDALAALRANTGAAGLYGREQIRALFGEGQLFERDESSDSFVFTMGWWKSDDLETFSPLRLQPDQLSLDSDGQLVLTVPGDSSDVQFYQFQLR